MEGLAKAGFADAHKVLARERRKPALWIGTFKHDADQLGLLVRFKPWRAPIAPAIVKAIEAVRIVADHPVPQGLAVHAGRLRGFLPAHAGKRIGDRKQPPRHARVGFGLGQLAQHRWSAIPSYGQRRHEPLLRIMRIGNHAPATCEIAAAQQESVFPYGGIIPSFSALSWWHRWSCCHFSPERTGPVIRKNSEILNRHRLATSGRTRVWKKQERGHSGTRLNEHATWFAASRLARLRLGGSAVWGLAEAMMADRGFQKNEGNQIAFRPTFLSWQCQFSYPASASLGRPWRIG